VSGELQAPAALPPRKQRHWEGGWMGLTTGVEEVEKTLCPLPEIEPRFLGDGVASLISITYIITFSTYLFSTFFLSFISIF
jgi:hypothetical protein